MNSVNKHTIWQAVNLEHVGCSHKNVILNIIKSRSVIVLYVKVLCPQKLSDCMTKGAVLCLKNVVKDTTREQIKETFMEYLPVAYIEFSIGDTEVSARRHEAVPSVFVVEEEV